MACSFTSIHLRIVRHTNGQWAWIFLSQHETNPKYTQGSIAQMRLVILVSSLNRILLIDWWNFIEDHWIAILQHLQHFPAALWHEEARSSWPEDLRISGRVLCFDKYIREFARCCVYSSTMEDRRVIMPHGEACSKRGWTLYNSSLIIVLARSKQ